MEYHSHLTVEIPTMLFRYPLLGESRWSLEVRTVRLGGAARKSGGIAVPSFDFMQIRVARSQSRTPRWVSVNAFAHLQLREGACARAPVVFSLVGSLGAARE